MSKEKKFDIKKHIVKIKDDLVVDRLNAIEWCVLGVVLLLVFLTLFYADNMGMFLTYFWINEGLFKGTSIRFLGNNQLPYGIVQQWFCTVWTLPVNIAYRFYKFSAANTITALWYKLSMPFVLTLCMAQMQRIGELLGISKERIKWMLILFSSTILVALPVFHIAQSDILYTYLSLLALEAYIKDDTKKFIFYFALTISCKAVAVIIFIPLVLMREKRIRYIFRDSVLGASVLLIERIWFKIIECIDRLITGRTAPITIEKEVVEQGTTTVVEKSLDQANVDFFSHFYHKALYFEFPAVRKGYVAALLVVLFVLLCIWCYTQKKNDGYWAEKSIYAISVSWLIFFVNASPSPYWIVALYPSLFLLIFLKPERVRTNMILQNVFTLTMFTVYVVNTDWVYGGPSNLDYLLLKGLLKEGHDSVDGPYVARYLNNLGIQSVMNVIVAICLAVSIGLIAVNFHKAKVDDELSEKDEKILMHGFAVWQIGFLAVWYMINVWVVQRW